MRQNSLRKKTLMIINKMKMKIVLKVEHFGVPASSNFRNSEAERELKKKEGGGQKRRQLPASV